MKLKLVDETIILCESHLDSTKNRQSRIDLILASYLAVYIHSAFEQEIERLLKDRADHGGDQVLGEFMASCVGAVFRSSFTSEMAGVLGRFGDKFKAHFQSEMKSQPQASTAWDSIVTHRHGTAHESGGGKFVHEIVDFYNRGHVVLDAFKAALDATKTS